MKCLTILGISVITLQGALIGWLVIRARAQDERLVAACATAIGHFRYSEALREVCYGDFSTDQEDSELVQDIDAIHGSMQDESLWYEWVHVYCYAITPPTKRPYSGPLSLTRLDLLAMPNFPKWVDDSNFASDSSRSSFEDNFAIYVNGSKFAGKLRFCKTRRPRKYSTVLKYNLPKTPEKKSAAEANATYYTPTGTVGN